MQVERMVMGPIQNNVYIVSAGEDAQSVVVVDPTCQPEHILHQIGERTCDAILLTHAHWDHVGAAQALRDATGARVIASEIDAPVIEGTVARGGGSREFTPCPVDEAVSDSDIFTAAGIEWRTILTPGHTPGSMCLFVEADPEDADALPVLVSGDTLFCGTIGRTDFEGGSMADMSASLAKLALLPDDTVVLPGHNDLTTIARERRRTLERYSRI